MGHLSAEHYKQFVRSLVVIVGCAAIWWGLVELPIFWQEASAESVASRIIAGDPFKTEILTRQIAIINGIEASASCRPAAVKSAAIIQLRIVESAIAANDQERRGDHLDALGNAIRSSLACSPADPFLWLVLYWVESTHSGLKPDNLKYLRMSYQLGANEGWIGVNRNRIAFSEFDELPADLRDSVISEFVGLLGSGFYQQAAEIFMGLAWQERELILPRLVRVSDQNRQLFANVLFSRGYDVNVPGVVRRDSSPRH